MAGPDSSSHGVSRVVHHKDFYLRGGDMTVLVENHLYRIHSYFFERESLFFRQKISTTNNPDEDRGSTDHNAYTLEDVKSEDFARFLWVFYNPKYSVYEAPLETWLSILKLANRWTFDNVKELAVQELEKIEIEAVEKISIYHENSISRLYLIPSYIAVCKRDKPLSFREGTNLGMETVLRIAEARERLRLQASESGIRTPTFEDFEDTEVEVLIREIFQLGSRPTSPSSVTSPTNGVNGASHTTVKLGPAPAGNPSKANGASAPRANGVLAADARGSSVNTMPSIASIIHQDSAVATPLTATQTPAATQSTRPQATAQRAAVPHEQQAPVPPSKAPQAASPSPPSVLQLATDKAKDPKETASQEANSLSSLLSPMSGGVGEPSSSAESKAGSHDVSISNPVVPPSERSNDMTADSNENVNDAEKDESGKDNDTASVFSENEGSKPGKQGTKRKGGTKNNGRGGKTKP